MWGVVVSIAKVAVFAWANSVCVDTGASDSGGVISPSWTFARVCISPITTFANLKSVGSSLLTGSGPAFAYMQLSRCQCTFVASDAPAPGLVPDLEDSFKRGEGSLCPDTSVYNDDIAICASPGVHDAIWRRATRCRGATGYIIHNGNGLDG